MPLYLKEGKLLVNGGKLAVSSDCCCGSLTCNDCAPLFDSYGQAILTFADGTPPCCSLGTIVCPFLCGDGGLGGGLYPGQRIYHTCPPPPENRGNWVADCTWCWTSSCFLGCDNDYYQAYLQIARCHWTEDSTVLTWLVTGGYRVGFSSCPTQLSGVDFYYTAGTYDNCPPISGTLNSCTYTGQFGFPVTPCQPSIDYELQT